jgi:hypothetical protein
VQLPQLRRIRWAVRAALFLGVAASVAANVLHAQPNPISQTISAWPPLALLLTVELTSRIPMHKPILAGIRVLATMAIAGIAAWVSYWHMQNVAVRFGETEVSAYLLPLSVDGLIVVASVSLVELAGRIRVLEERAAREMSRGADPAPAPSVTAPSVTAPTVTAVTVAQPAPAPIAPPAPAPIPEPAAAPEPAPAAVAEPTHAPALADGGRVSTVRPATIADIVPDKPDMAAKPTIPARPDAPVKRDITDTPTRAPRVPTSPLSGKPLSQSAPVSPVVAATTRPTPSYVNGSTPRTDVARPAVSAPSRTVVTAAADSDAPRQRRPVQETAELANEIEAMNPNISQTELAKRLGISPTRLRAVRREAREVRRASSVRN